MEGVHNRKKEIQTLKFMPKFTINLPLVVRTGYTPQLPAYAVDEFLTELEKTKGPFHNMKMMEIWLRI